MGCPVEVCEWISYFIPQLIINYLSTLGLKLVHVSTWSSFWQLWQIAKSRETPSSVWTSACTVITKSGSQTLHWRHNGRNGVPNHRRVDCLLNRMFRHRSKKTSKLCVTGLCEGNDRWPVKYPTQWANIMENDDVIMIYIYGIGGTWRVNQTVFF